MKYSSNAKWTKIKDTKDFGCNPTKEFSENICIGLLNKYGVRTEGCEIRGHCIEAWVEDENGNIIGPTYPR